jgi:hypothetical protein
MMDSLVICTCSPGATPRSMSGHALCCPLDEAWRKEHFLERLPQQPHTDGAETFEAGTLEIKHGVPEGRVVGRITYVRMSDESGDAPTAEQLDEAARRFK